MSRTGTLVDVVRSHLTKFADCRAVTFLGEGPPATLTYAELDRSSRSMAVWLRDRVRPGERVVLLYPPGLGFVGAFLGCLYAGVVAVPGPSPAGYANQRARLAGILKDSGAALALTDEAEMSAVGALLDGETPPLVAGDVAAEADPDSWRQDVASDALAFLQYTSGSTAQPKGVMVSHGALRHNLEGMRETTAPLGDRLRFGSWLPTSHDMGLVGMLLEPLYQGGSTVLMTPTSFLKRPHRWLEMIDRYRVQVSAAPNFGYDLCARRITDEQIATLDLSDWAVAGNGSEPIDAGTLTRFAARLAPAGFRAEAMNPCYGLAEATLQVSASRVDRPPVVRQFGTADLLSGRLAPASDAPSSWLVSSGVVRNLEVRIVDPDCREELTEGQVGEIWLRGKSVAEGYWRQPDDTRRVFDAATAVGDKGFMRTGDLGALVGTELFVTGRLKDVLVVHGRNLYPHDLEKAVAEVDPAFHHCHGAVFALTSGRESIVVVQEVKLGRRPADDLGELTERIKKRLRGEFGVTVGAVVLVRPGAVRRTTSGKTQRTLMRKLFAAGRLEPLFADLSVHLEERSVPCTATSRSS